MNFRTYRHNQVSFGGAPAAVKQWAIGWTTNEAAQAANRMGRDHPSTPGTFGARASGGHLGTMR